MNLHSMNVQFFFVFEGYELFSEAVLIVAEVMSHFVVGFQVIVIFVVSVFPLFGANVAGHVF